MDPFGVVAISACAAISLEYLVLRCGLHGSFASARWPTAKEQQIKEIVRVADIVLDAYETDSRTSNGVTATADGDVDDHDGTPNKAKNPGNGVGDCSQPHALQRLQEQEQHPQPQQRTQSLKQLQSKNLFPEGEGSEDLGTRSLRFPRHGDHTASMQQGSSSVSQELRHATDEIRPLQVDAAGSGNGSCVESRAGERAATEGLRDHRLCNLVAGSPNIREPCTIRVLKRMSATGTGYLIPPYVITYDSAADDVCLAVRGMHLYNEHDYLTLLDSRAGRQGLQVRRLHRH